ncbi:hypothetical protein RQP46_004391 [Phenoliferia psychrophenolica]
MSSTSDFSFSPGLIQVNDPSPAPAPVIAAAPAPAPPPLPTPAHASSSSAPPLPASAADGQPLKARRAFKGNIPLTWSNIQGDLNNPHDPPCTRCRREGVVCEFLPSRRGGRVPFNSQKKSRDNQSVEPEKHGGGAGASGWQDRRRSVQRDERDERDDEQEQEDSPYEDDGPEDQPLVIASSAMGHIGDLSAISANRPHDFTIVPPFPKTEIGRAALRFPPTIPVPPPISSSDIFRHPRPTSNGDGSPANSKGSEPSPADTVSDGRGSDGSGLPRRKKRRLSDGGPVDAETLATASLRNPVDALDLLVLAADEGGRETLEENGAGVENGHGGDANGKNGGDATMSEASPGSRGKGTTDADAVKPLPPPPSLRDFPLVKKGVLTTRKLCELVDLFFSRCHFIFPVVPEYRVPRTEEQLAKFASEELHLMTVFIVIASRHDKNPKVHDKSWAYLQTLINEIILGKSVGVGAVEALLLLSEYLPRRQDVAASKVNTEETNMAWMLAVRLGYMLSLDQKTLLPAKSLAESTDGTAEENLLNRERVAWTYCYLFDRQISVRSGKAFWSRGPGLCFTGGIGGVQPSAAKNFPAFRFIPDIQDDFASLLQAYVELTQIMTSSHDILYPSRERTVSLIKTGEYYKYIDEFQRSLEAFRMTWEGKRWATYPLTECVWITFHYMRLYIFSFAFQAHVQRATMNEGSDDGNRPFGNQLFPAGLVASPDAKFILEAIDAAADLLRLVTDRLHPGGALPFLPWRFFMMFSYAGVFLLKAVYVQAVAPVDRVVIIRLLKRVIFVLACASNDDQHPGVRYARLLNGLLRAFSQGHESMNATRAPTPDRRASPQPDPGPEPLPLDFMSAFVAGGTTTATTSPLPQASGQAEFPENFGFNNLSMPSFAFNPTGGTSSGVGSQNQSFASTPFPMQPFSESQPFHQLASTLDSTLDLDFGLFEDPELPAPLPTEAFNFLLEDSQLDFWTSFDTAGGADWTSAALGGTAGGGV